jgi:hypothetical protein
MCHPSHSIAAPSQSAVNSLSVGRSVQEDKKRRRGYRERGGRESDHRKWENKEKK